MRKQDMPPGKTCLYSTRSECAHFWQRIFERDEEGETKAWWHVERSDYVPGSSRPSSTFFETDEVAAKKARQKARIVTASSIYLCSILLASCASPPTEKKSSQSTPIALLSIVFTANRFLELEPCGCMLNPKGGVDQEWNLLKKKNPAAAALVLSAGTTFVPLPSAFKEERKATYLRKCRFFVDALNELGINVLSPSIDDLGLGLEEVRKLQVRSKFEWISSNLYERSSGKPLFPPYLEVKHDSLPILILGVSHPPTIEFPYKPDPAVEVLPPVKAIRKILRQLDKTPRLVVLLSSLARREQEEIEKELPEVHLVLGGAPDDELHLTHQLSGSLLYVNPPSRGRAVAFVELELKYPFQNFYNASVSIGVKSSREHWSGFLEDTKIKLKEYGLSREQKEELKLQLDRYQWWLQRSASIPMEPKPDSVLYQSSFVDVTPDFAKPKNKLTKIIDLYRAELRRLALEGE